MGKIHEDARIAWLIYTNPLVIAMHKAFPATLEGLIVSVEGIPNGARHILLHLLNYQGVDYYPGKLPGQWGEEE